ncbi:hypothetical protein ACLOJK_014047 [Asimina triloba]
MTYDISDVIALSIWVTVEAALDVYMGESGGSVVDGTRRFGLEMDFSLEVKAKWQMIQRSRLGGRRSRLEMNFSPRVKAR